MRGGGLGHVLRSLRDSACRWCAILYLVRETAGSRSCRSSSSSDSFPGTRPGAPAYPVTCYLVVGQWHPPADGGFLVVDFREHVLSLAARMDGPWRLADGTRLGLRDRKSTRLNSSH